VRLAVDSAAFIAFARTSSSTASIWSSRAIVFGTFRHRDAERARFALDVIDAAPKDLFEFFSCHGFGVPDPLVPPESVADSRCYANMINFWRAKSRDVDIPPCTHVYGRSAALLEFDQ